MPEHIPAQEKQSEEPTEPARAAPQDLQPVPEPQLALVSAISTTATRPPHADAAPETPLVPPRTVEIDDLVTYVDVDHPDNVLSVRIVHGNSYPDTGEINEQTPLGEALLGAEEGDTVEAHLPMGTTKNINQGSSRRFVNEASGKR